MDDKATIELILETRESLARMQAFERDFKQALAAMAAAVKAGLDPSTAEVKQLEAAVTATGRDFIQAGERGEAAMRALAAATGKESAELVELRAKLAAAHVELDRFHKEGATGTASLTKGFGAVRMAVAAVATSLIGLKIADFVRGSVAAAIEAENALTRVQASIDATDGAAGRTLDQIEAIAKRIHDTTTFADDDVLGLANTLLTFENIVGKTFDRTISVVVDLAAKTGRSLEETGQAVGKALSLGAEGIAQLRRSGVVLSDEQEATIKRLFETNREIEGQNRLLEALEGKAEGAAEKLNAKLGGALGNLKKQFEEVQEAFGKAFGEELARSAQEGTDALKGMEQPAKDTGRALGTITTALGQLLKFGWPLLSADATRSFGDIIKGAAGVADAVLRVTEYLNSMALRARDVPILGRAFKDSHADSERLAKSIKEMREGAVRDMRELGDEMVALGKEKWTAAVDAIANHTPAATAAVADLADAGDRAAPALSGTATAGDKATAAVSKLADAGRDSAASAKEMERAWHAAVKAANDAALAHVEEHGARPSGARPSDIDALAKERKELLQTVEALQAKQEQGTLTAEELSRLTEADDRLRKVQADLGRAVDDVNAALRAQVENAMGASGALDDAGRAIHGYEVAVTTGLANLHPEFEKLDANVRRVQESGEGAERSVEGLTVEMSRQAETARDGTQVIGKLGDSTLAYTVDTEKAAGAVEGLRAGQAKFNRDGQVMAAVLAAGAKGTEQLGAEAKTTEQRVADLEAVVAKFIETQKAAFDPEVVEAWTVKVETRAIPAAQALKACLDSIE